MQLSATSITMVREKKTIGRFVWKMNGTSVNTFLELLNVHHRTIHPTDTAKAIHPGKQLINSSILRKIIFLQTHPLCPNVIASAFERELLQFPTAIFDGIGNFLIDEPISHPLYMF